MEDVKTKSEPVERDLNIGSPVISGSMEDRVAFLEALMISALQELEPDQAQEIIRISPHKVDNLPVFYAIQKDYYKAVLRE